MIFFGISCSVRTGKPLPDRCPHCSETSMISTRRYRYFHLFWLPVIPLGSVVSAVCSHCKLHQEKDEMEPSLKDRAVRGSVDLKRPRWHFIGTALIAAIISMNMYNDAELEERAEQAAAEPRVGDVWIVDVQDTWEDSGYPYRYSAGRVSQVNGDEVALTMSDWSFAISSGIRKKVKKALQKEEGNFFVHDVAMSVPQIVALQASDDLRLFR